MDYYPYPFLDVDQHGYPLVGRNCLLVGVVFVALGAGAHALDRWLARARR